MLLLGKKLHTSVIKIKFYFPRHAREKKNRKNKFFALTGMLKIKAN